MSVLGEIIHMTHNSGKTTLAGRRSLAPANWQRRSVTVVRRVLGEAAEAPSASLVKLPGRGVTRVWECAGPRGAETLVLIHGVAVTAELNWGKVLAPLGRHFRVVAADLRGHGDGINLGCRFRLEDCADDVAALAQALGLRRFAAVGYSMGGMVAQLLYRRHPSLLSGLVLCSTAGNVRETPAEKLAALALPATAAALRWNPVLQLVSAEALGMALLGHIDDPATAGWARAQLSRTSLAAAVSAVQAVCEFSSDGWISQIDVPAAVVVTTGDRIVPASRQLKLARVIPGASVHQVDADHGVCINAPQLFAPALLEACWSVAPGRGGRGPLATLHQSDRLSSPLR
jgi:3-oxoadipate enol-lactonase